MNSSIAKTNIEPASAVIRQKTNGLHPAKHINKLRWLSLSVVFAMLLIIPVLHIYQTQTLSHAYDLLSSSEQLLYDTSERIALLFTSNPEKDLNQLKGNTWSGTLFGVKMSDPLAVSSQIFASGILYWPVMFAALIPLLVTLIFGRIYCGWICPATFIYELNDNLRTWLTKLNVPLRNKQLDKRIKYGVLVLSFLLCAITGSVITASIYPPAIVGRELYYSIVFGGFSAGGLFFIATLLFDTLVSKRGFCTYLCPGGALFSLLGKCRLIRIQRKVELCNDCTKCNAVCQFSLQPMRDEFGKECNNCTACVAVCPNNALTVTLKTKDSNYNGPGHQGKLYKANQN